MQLLWQGLSILGWLIAIFLGYENHGLQKRMKEIREKLDTLEREHRKELRQLTEATKSTLSEIYRSANNGIMQQAARQKVDEIFTEAEKMAKLDAENEG